MKWRAHPLHPDTPAEGLTLEKLFENYPVNLNEMMRRLKNKAREAGLPFGERTMTYNSRLAQELGSWAESKGRGDAFHMAAFKAYFVDGRNIARRPVLLELAERAGLPRGEAETVLETRSFRTLVDDDWALSRTKGITAVPTFVMGDAKLVGAQPYHRLAGFVEENGAEKTR